jgi:adenylate kinase family enzyme
MTAHEQDDAEHRRGAGRFAITGAAGAGKSTVGRELSAIYGIPHIDLDDLFNRPGWQEAPGDEFRRGVSAAIEAASSWAIDGRYHHLIDYVVWEHADTLVWLDLPPWIVLPRLLGRQVTQILRRRRRPHGDIETWRRTVKLIRLSVARRKELRCSIPGLVVQPALRHLEVVRLESPAAVTAWLEQQRARAGKRWPPQGAAESEFPSGVTRTSIPKPWRS